MDKNVNIKKCPFCFEEISFDAKKCRFCKERLRENNRNTNSILKKERTGEYKHGKSEANILADNKTYPKSGGDIKKIITEDTEKHKNESAKKWYQSWWGIIIMALLWPYFAIWAIWKKTDANRSIKIVLTAMLIFLAVSYIAVLLSINSENNPQEIKAKKEAVIFPSVQNISIENNTEEKARQEEARLAEISAKEEAKKKAIENARKKKEEEEKARLQAEEDKKNAQAEKYCAERKNSNRTFSILEAEINEAENMKSASPREAAKKKGSQLMKSDCRKIIDFMYDWRIERIQDIIEMKYWIGMEDTELLVSAGFPNKVNTDNYGFGETKQYIYYKDSYGINAYYIYIDEKGRVKSYQDF